MKVLISGGAGFIGSHLCRYLLDHTDWQIAILDKFTYASSGLARLKALGLYDNPRVQIFVGDCAKPLGGCLESDIGPVDYILHLAAGTHVDRSIACPREFLDANIFGTYEMLEYARHQKELKSLLYFSSDEAFGPAPKGVKFREEDRLRPANPYAATKAAGEELCTAWGNTYGLPVIITRCMNVMGEMQHPEKYLPRVVRSLLAGTVLAIHTDPRTGLSGSRNYLHTDDVASAVLFVLQRGSVGGRYHIASDKEISNLDLALAVARILGRELKYTKVNPVDVRPGFDVRYGLDGGKLAQLGWPGPREFEQRLVETVQWMTRDENLHWLKI